MLKHFYQDWVRAPISGTAVLLCGITSMVCGIRGDIDRGLLFVIVGSIISMQRGPYNGGRP